MVFGEGAALLATGAGHAISAGASAVHHGNGRAVKLGNGDHDGGFDGQQTPVGATPLVQGLELHRVCCDVGHIQFGQYFFGGMGVVVGGAAHQRKAGQGHHRVHRGLAVFQEKRVNGRA